MVSVICRILGLVIFLAIAIWMGIGLIIATDLMIDLYPETRTYKKIHGFIDRRRAKYEMQEIQTSNND